MSKISIIVAASKNLVIGKNGDLPWHLPSDLKYFKEKTTNSTVVMGRNCWDSIPDKYKPLPNRKNIVITRTNLVLNGATIKNNLNDYLDELINDGLDNEVFIIGGAQIYNECFKFAHKLYFTNINSEIEGDVYLKGFDANEWLLNSETDYMNENGYEFKFQVYLKK